MANSQTSYQSETDKALNSINRSLEEKQVIALAKQKGLDYVNIGTLNLNPDLCNIISQEEAQEALLMPFFQVGKKLRVAVLDPELPKTAELIQRLKQEKYILTVCLTSKTSLLEAFRLYDTKPEQNIEDFVTDIDEIKLDEYEKEIDLLFKELKDKIHVLPSAQLLNIILVGAIKTKASDIHLEPSKEKLTIRYRIDGMLQQIFDVPSDKMHELITQVKYKSKMKLNVTKRPQDGRFFFVINTDEIDVRVSALPTPFGEDIVLRILDSRKKGFSIDKLGLLDISKDILMQAIKKPHGMILTTGPTGSGKTTTLYAILQELNKPNTKIITIEDPIEYQLDGITQSQVAEDENYTFANGIRSIVRQDPDIVMIGEIRDLVTAEAAAQASLTGHKVLSTLHTNDAIGAIDRLVNMGLEHFMIAPALDTVIAQRLARVCCPKCSEDIALTNEQKELFEEMLQRINPILKKPIQIPDTIKKVHGCKYCSHTGYSGRVGLYEVIQITDEIKDMIIDKKSTNEIRHLVRQNSFSVFESGIMQVMKGVTTIEEVLRIAKIND